MSAHIAFPAFVRHVDPNVGADAIRPASVSRVLNETLLRERLGFNGLIVSDATPMGGFGAFAPRGQMLPEVIKNGCDLILFSGDPEADFVLIKAAISNGLISPARHLAALTRILGLKAALGLHNGPIVTASSQRHVLGCEADRATARAITARAPTLVKDMQALLPLSVQKHRRILIVSGGIVSSIHPEPIAFDLPQMLRDQGFE